MTGPVWRPFGADAVLVEFALPHERWSFRCPLADETVVGARTVLLRFDARRYRVADLRAAAHLVPSDAARPPRSHTIAVTYDGPDLVAVADAGGMSAAEYIRRHTRAEYRAEFCGFAPGFAYLSGLDPALASPRRANPRPRVPPGSLAVAGPYCAVYPSASPGGWNLLGTTTTRLFDPAAADVALIRPGDTVRFEALS